MSHQMSKQEMGDYMSLTKLHECRRELEKIWREHHG